MPLTIEKVFEKVCNGPTCQGQIQPASAFYRNAARPDGLASQCKRCQSEYASRDGVRERKNASTARWQQANPDKANAKVRRWTQENPENARLIRKRYEESDKGRATLDRRLERYDGLARPQREQARLAREQMWAENRAAKAQVRAEQKAAKAERKAYLRLYQPLMARLNVGYHRTLRLGLPVRADRIRPETLLAYWDSQGIDPTRCYYTGAVLEDGWHLDHKMPLARGGAHVVENLVPCTAAANMDKKNLTAEEYMEALNNDQAT